MEIKVRLPENLAELLRKDKEIDFSRVACIDFSFDQKLYYQEE